MIDKAISPASIQSMLQTLRSHQAAGLGHCSGHARRDRTERQRWRCPKNWFF
jgi:hypothetical protein